MTSHPLELRSVTKKFGSFTAVQDVSFHLGQGEIVGFLGPNGAGKSTSLRLALGIMSPDHGEARLFGEAPKLSNLKRVGFLPEERGLYKRLSARDTLAYFSRLKGMGRKEALHRADELLDMFSLGPFRNTRISKLSKGMAQKVQILSTLAHRPDILILDEPFSGLDPVNQSELETLIRAEHARGASILFSTHVMEHAERICDRIVLIASGRKMFDGTLQEAFATQDSRVRIATSAGQNLEALFSPMNLQVTPLHSEEDATEKAWWEIALSGGFTAQDALKKVIEAGIPVEGFEPGEKRLRDVFVSLVNEAEQKFGESRHG